MKIEGPELAGLLRRLAETPRDFLDAPRVGKSGTVSVRALAFDLSHQLGDPLSADELALFDGGKSTENWLSLCAVACWLFSEESVKPLVRKEMLCSFMDQTLRGLAAEYRAERYVVDPERREELVRILLADLGARPAGETVAQAQDRLEALSSTERRRILAAARETEKRARELREALIQKAAAESADKYTRE